MDDEPLLYSFKEKELLKLKRQDKNLNLTRSENRSNAVKSSMWYDLNICTESFEVICKSISKQINNLRNSFSTRIKYLALLKVADLVEQNLIVSLREAWDLYSSTSTSEYEALHKIPPKYNYRSTDARDLFLRNLPLIVIYKDSQFGPQAHTTKRLSGVQWTLLINKIEWPSLDQLVKAETIKKINTFVKPALSFATTERDRQILKFILTKLTGAKYMSKHCEIVFDKKSLIKNEIKTQTNVN